MKIKDLFFSILLLKVSLTHIKSTRQNEKTHEEISFYHFFSLLFYFLFVFHLFHLNNKLRLSHFEFAAPFYIPIHKFVIYTFKLFIYKFLFANLLIVFALVINVFFSIRSLIHNILIGEFFSNNKSILRAGKI